jgi:hypothetical protein
MQASSCWSPLSPSFRPPSFPTPIWLCPWRAAGVPTHRNAFLTTLAKCALTPRIVARWAPTRASGAALPYLLGGAHARAPRLRCGSQKWKQHWTEPTQIGILAHARRCHHVSSWYVRSQLVRALQKANLRMSVLTTARCHLVRPTAPGLATLGPNSGAIAGTPSVVVC